MQKNTLFLIFNDQAYGHIGTANQYYIEHIAKKNKVLLISPSRKWSFKNLYRRPYIVIKEKNISEFTYVNYVPSLQMISIGLQKIVIYINDLLNFRFLGWLRNFDLVYFYFEPFRGVCFVNNHQSPVIYFIRDPYFHLPLDKNLARKSSLIVLLNSRLMNHYTKLNRNILRLPHGISKQDLHVNKGETERLKNEYGDYILFIGSLNDDVDYQLLNKIAESFSSKVVVIGEDKSKKEGNAHYLKSFLGKENVVCLGFMHYKNLKTYISASKVCIVPYKTNLKGFYRNPIKIAHYLAQKKVIINTVDLEDLYELENRVLYTAQDHQKFILLLGQTLAGEIKVDQKFCDDYIARNSYGQLFSRIMSSINEVNKP